MNNDDDNNNNHNSDCKVIDLSSIVTKFNVPESDIEYNYNDGDDDDDDDDDDSVVDDNDDGNSSRTRFAVLIHDVLSQEECQQLIDRAEEHEGFTTALLNVGGGRQILANDVRKSDRCIIDDIDYTAMLFDRIVQKLKQHDQNMMAAASQQQQQQKQQPLLPQLMSYKLQGTLHTTGLNERLRILRYDHGCYFLPHFDGRYIRQNELGIPSRIGEQSKLSVLLYLNDTYVGGRTRFLNQFQQQFGTWNDPQQFTKEPTEPTEPSGFDVDIRPGSVLLFDHQCLHEGQILQSGRKYVVRTDVMYTTLGPGLYHHHPQQKTTTTTTNATITASATSTMPPAPSRPNKSKTTMNPSSEQEQVEEENVHTDNTAKRKLF